MVGFCNSLSGFSFILMRRSVLMFCSLLSCFGEECGCSQLRGENKERAPHARTDKRDSPLKEPSTILFDIYLNLLDNSLTPSLVNMGTPLPPHGPPHPAPLALPAPHPSPRLHGPCLRMYAIFADHLLRGPSVLASGGDVFLGVFRGDECCVARHSRMYVLVPCLMCRSFTPEPSVLMMRYRLLVV